MKSRGGAQGSAASSNTSSPIVHVTPGIPATMQSSSDTTTPTPVVTIKREPKGKGKRPRSLSPEVSEAPESSSAAQATPQLSASPDAITALTELRQDFVLLIGVTERLESTVIGQADALADAKDLFKIFLPVIEAIVEGNRENFNKLKPSIVANIESYKTRVSELRQQITT